jgi:PII-like signaling protein
MAKIESEQTLMRIFLGESDRWEHRPLFEALLEILRREGFAGATVLKGVAGFGARSILHTDKLLRLSADLPVIIEVVDVEEKIERILPVLDRMMHGGMITLEKVRVIQYPAKDSTAH